MSDLYPVKAAVAARSHVKSMDEYERLYRLSLDNPDWFWGEQAKAITWFHPWQIGASTPTTTRSTSPGSPAAA